MTVRASRLPLLWVTLGVVAVAISARLTVPVPGSPVPQSAQTLAVVLVGAWMGARGAALTLAAYALVGALGMPVFSDGGSGWEHLVGSTGGYIVGFVVSGVAIGWCADAGLLRRAVSAFGVLLLGHVVILALGWAWLASSVGAGPAFDGGVAPFILGGIAKAAMATALVVASLRFGLASPGEGLAEQREA